MCCCVGFGISRHVYCILCLLDTSCHAKLAENSSRDDKISILGSVQGGTTWAAHLHALLHRGLFRLGAANGPLVWGSLYKSAIEPLCSI
jgi:hypothetical protein